MPPTSPVRTTIERYTGEPCAEAGEQVAKTASMFPVFGEVALRFLQDESGVDLGASADWKWTSSVVRESERGTAATIDVVATSPDGGTELWFDLRLASSTRTRDAADAVDAGDLLGLVSLARRHAARRRRIYLVLATRRNTFIRERERLPSPVDTPVALLNKSESFRWSDWPAAIARRADDSTEIDLQDLLVDAALTILRVSSGMSTSAAGASASPPPERSAEEFLADLRPWEPTLDWLVTRFGGRSEHVTDRPWVGVTGRREIVKEFWPAEGGRFTHLSIEVVNDDIAEILWNAPEAGTDEILVRCWAWLTFQKDAEGLAAVLDASPDRPPGVCCRIAIIPESLTIDACIRIGGWRESLSLAEQAELLRQSVGTLVEWLDRVVAGGA